MFHVKHINGILSIITYVQMYDNYFPGNNSILYTPCICQSNMIKFRSTTDDCRTWSGLENSSHKMKIRVCFFLEEIMNREIIDKLFELAVHSYEEDEFPVSAIVFDNSGILGTGYNRRNHTKKTTDHAEIIAIEEANRTVHNWNLQDKCMVVTLEPCDMCKSVIKEARLSKVYFLVPRFSYKKQYKNTVFSEYDIDDKRLENYKNNITTFFANKR